MESKPLSFVIRRLSQIIALAALYYLTARLGFLMALPPGNVTALWPPSGLALAAVMIWGWPSGLGVLIGSLIVNWESMSGAAALPVAAAIASGSTLQAWGAAWLIRRFNKVFPPATVRNTVLTIGLISLATLLAPAVGVTSLCLANYTQWDNSITLATTWWMGDLIGILIFAPGLILLALRWRKQPVQEVFLWPLTCLIFGLALFTFLFFKTNQQQQLSAQVQNDGNKMARVIQQTIDREIEALIAIRAFYNASIEVTAEEFTAFTTPLLADSPADPATAAGFEWIPRVTQVERASYEQAIRAGGYADFSIYEKGGQKENVPAAEREEYFPVTWINPFAPNQAAFGFDLASNPARLETIVLARDTGQPAATAPLQLVQDTANQTSVLIMAPVYRAGAPGETLEERRANLIGMSLGVYRVNLLLKRALEHTNRHDLEVYLYDIVNEDSPQFLGFYPSISGPQELPEAGAPAPAALRNGLYQNATITVGGRAWLVLIRPGPAYISSSEDWFAWIVLLIGLLAASAFLAYVNTRQKSEAVLARSEARYRLISENTGDVIWILDLESQRFVYVSHSVEKLRGYPPEEVLNQSLADALTPRLAGKS